MKIHMHLLFTEYFQGLNQIDKSFKNMHNGVETSSEH